MDILTLANAINTNKMFAGLTMIMMNFGTRYIMGDLTKMHERLMMSTAFKQFVMFCIFFAATRDVIVSVMLTFTFTFVLYGLLNENKKLNLWHSSYVAPESHPKAVYKENLAKLPGTV